MFGYNQLPFGSINIPPIREVWIQKDEFGFGFSIAGENPCHVNHIITGSPADKAGLKQMEYILLINGKNVRHLSHEVLIKEISGSEDIIKLGLSESKLSSLHPGSYGLIKPHMLPFHPQMDFIPKPLEREPFQEIHVRGQRNHRDALMRHQTFDGALKSEHPTLKNKDHLGPCHDDDVTKQVEIGLAKKKLRMYCKNNYAPQGKNIENVDMILTEIQKPLIEKLNNVSDLMGDSRVPWRTEIPDISYANSDKENKANKYLKPNLKKRLDKYLPQEIEGLNKLDINEGTACFIVNYISSTDVPFDPKVKTHGDAATVAAKRVHASKTGEFVALLFSSGKGIKLINRSQKLVGSYSLDRISWCGEPTLSETGKVFVIVVSYEEHSISNCNACHVFRINTSISHHSRHASLASVFGVKCNTSSENMCLEFPKTTDEVICCIAPCIGQLKDSESFKSSLSSGDGHVDQDPIRVKVSMKEHLKQEKIKFFNQDLMLPIATKRPAPDNSIDEVPCLPNKKPPTAKPPGFISKPFMPTPSKAVATITEFESSNKILLTSRPCKPSFDKKMVPLKRAGDVPENFVGSFRTSSVQEFTNDSGLTHNKSICSSYEGFLDNIEKDKRKGCLSKETDLHKNLSSSFGDIDKILGEDISRAGQWAVSFEFLLNDEAGLATFMQFLKKEFCSENLLFWLKCKNFKKLFSSASGVDNEVVVGELKDIYNNHIITDAAFEVNIDWTTKMKIESRMKDDPASLCDIFDAAQNHIQQLMKQDKYERFKTSELYTQALDDEKSGRPYEYPYLSHASEVLGKGTESLKKGKTKTDDKRKSLLSFWKRRKSVRQSLDGGATLAKNSDQQGDRHSLKQGSGSSINSLRLPSTNSLNLLKGKNYDSYCKAVLPNTGVMARIQTSTSSTVAECLSKLGSSIDPGIPFMHPMEDESGKLIPLYDPSNTISSKTISFMRLGYFRLDLPGCKPLLVRFKMDSSLLDVLSPVLSSSGLHNQDVVLKVFNTILSREQWKFNASLFNCKTVVIENMKNGNSSELEVTRVLQNLEEVQCKSPSVAALKDLFQDVLPQVMKNSPFTAFFSYLMFDKNGVSNLDGAEEWLKLQKRSAKSKFLNFIKRTSIEKGVLQLRNSMNSMQVDPSENNIRSSIGHFPVKTDEKLINLLSKVQAWDIDEQRGKCSAQYTKLPDFLRDQDAVSAQAEEIEICPDLFPSNNKFVIDRRKKREETESPGCEDAFEFVENNWDELLNDDDRMSLFGKDGIIPTVEQADLFFLGGATPPPLTIIERDGYDDVFGKLV